MSYRTLFTLLFLVCSLYGTPLLWAQEVGKEITVTAGTMRYLPDGTVEAEGEVTVRGEGVTVRADFLRYNAGSDTLLLTGNVVMEEDGGGAFRGDSLVLDLADLTGGISSGEIIIVQNGFRVRGDDIRRVAPDEYSISKGVFTSCPGDCPDWSFTASEIEVRREGYLEAKHAAFRILNVPVFYTPYLLYPVKTQRQTGFLFPQLGFSEETGVESKWPFFITLGPHADATVSPRTFSRDDLGLELDSRYRLHWGGGGTISGFSMTGERAERWYVRAEHSMALHPDLWLRGRWYDTGDPDTGAAFGETLEDRYPGALFRHASLEGKYGLAGYLFQSSSLLTEGSLARSDLPGTLLERDLGALRLGPDGGDLWRAGITAEGVRFDNGDERTLLVPSLDLRIPGPGRLAGNISGRAIIGTGGEGSDEDKAYLASWEEKIAVESAGEWGKHRVDMGLTASVAQGADFGGSSIRDGKDLVQERNVIDARVSSDLTSSRLRWEFIAGSWWDEELDMIFNYGGTRLNYSGFFLKASGNRDAEFGLVLPSLAVDEESFKGWEVESGYNSKAAGITLGRESAKGFPEIFRLRGYVALSGVKMSGWSSYDMDTDSVTYERIALNIPGRCWKLQIARTRTPDRTDWSLEMELGI